MRRSTGPCTELLGAPSTFGTRCTGPDRDRPVFPWTELWTGPISLDRALLGPVQSCATWEKLQKKVDGPDRGPTVFSAGPRYLMLDRGTWCCTGPGPTSLSFGPDRDRTDPTEPWTGTGTDLKNPGPTHL
uniref:Uncharacterized protein n=1 Tax=Plectus sambesii TaxID=2011161 RepID=A0A914UT99_9BILA